MTQIQTYENGALGSDGDVADQVDLETRLRVADVLSQHGRGEGRGSGHYVDPRLVDRLIANTLQPGEYDDRQPVDRPRLRPQQREGLGRMFRYLTETDAWTEKDEAAAHRLLGLPRLSVVE